MFDTTQWGFYRGQLPRFQIMGTWVFHFELYIITSICVLLTPNAGQNVHFHFFLNFFQEFDVKMMKHEYLCNRYEIL